MNRFRLASAVVAATVAIGGCVSSSKYERLAADKNQEIAGLQNEKGSLQDQLAGMEKEKSSLQEEIAALERQKAALQSTSQENQAQYDALVTKLSAEVERGQLQVRRYKNMLSVDVAEKIFFDSGRAVLKRSGQEVLKTVGEALKSYEDKIIRVVGYTDNVPMAKSARNVFPTNWELSVARATNVVRFLQDTGVPPERMVAAGRGEYSPVAPNDTPEGRQKNRRIEIMLIDQSLNEELSK
jgi:chemotaxis protein MotB